MLKWKDEEGQEQRLCLVDQVSAQWYNFGMLLGFSLNQLDGWEAEYRGNASRCWNRVMDQWLTQGGSHDYPATWEGLCTLLTDTGFAKTSKMLKNALCNS